MNKPARNTHRSIICAIALAASGRAVVHAGGVPPAQFLEQHASGCTFNSGDYLSVTAGTGLDTYYRYFIEVPPGLASLRVDLFDADFGFGGGTEVYDRASGGWNSSIRYQLYNPSGTLVTTLTGNASGPAGSNAAWINLYNTASPANGHWQLRMDTSSAVTTGDDFAGHAIRAHDGDPTGGGVELPIYADSFAQFGIHAGATVTWDLYPYIDAGGAIGFEADSNDFDLDNNGAIDFTSRSGSFTYANPAVSGNGVWRNEAFAGWTSDYLADDYGIWTTLVDVSVPSNYVTYYIANWTAANAPPTAQPEANTYRIYLPADAGGPPTKPWVSQMLSWMGGPNPPAVGSTTTVRVTVTVDNQTAYPITFSAANQVTVNVPVGTSFAGNETASQGTITGAPLLGGQGDITWNPGTIGANTTTTLYYHVDVTPASPALRIPLTGGPALNGTTANYVDETGNTTQAAATFSFGPLSELAVTEGSLIPGDSDGDGIPDVIEGGFDTDGDGHDDYLDLDADDDGIEDSVEGLTQTDLDGIPDYLDPDSDNDGVWDLIEGNDADMNGVTDYPVADLDNDGQIDVIVDADADGLDDAYDTTLAGVSAAIQNSDADLVRDWRDTDDDGDGILTFNEDGNLNGDWSDDDPDADGHPAYLDLDADNDGIPDATESTVDSDGDGVSDFLDLDADNDGIEDRIEGTVDTDGDLVPDYLDLDADNDGVWDLIEGNDADRNGITDYPVVDADNDGQIDIIADADGDGLDDAYDTTMLGNSAATQNSDSDAIPDWRDVDDDGDGIPTRIEDGNGNGDWSDDDPDADGRPAYLDLDSDDDGIPDATEGIVDHDGDGHPDFLDLDADNDGIPDVVEGNGDSDGDGVPNYLDLDSDNDGIPDTIEAGAPDANGDGIIDGFVDLNGDGLHDPLRTSPLPTVDSDRDAVVDRVDLDVDNDGIPDTLESGAPDSNRDGLVDPFIDLNGNGLADAVDPSAVPPGTPLGLLNGDSDPIADRYDLDADNDGIPDTLESLAPDVDRDGLIDPFVDGNGNGLADVVDPAASPAGIPLGIVNNDSDAVIDRLDIDADNDAVPDTLEAGAADSDRDGRIDPFVDGNGNGLADSIDPAASPAGAPLALVETDGDTVVDRLDLDADNDGLTDTIEAGAADSNRDGRVDPFVDGNGNGLTDAVDPSATPAGSALAILNGDLDPIVDRLDVDADDDGITDCTEGDGPMPGPDADGDGRIDGFTDVNRNGLADRVDPAATPAGTPLEVTDTDAIAPPDYLDLDTDEDLIADVEEGFDPDVVALGTDADGDGLDDAWDPDASGGVIADLPDDDFDLVRDWRDDTVGCLLANVPIITPVLGIKLGADVEWTWDPATDAESYNTWVVDGSILGSNKAEIPNARDAGSWPTVIGCLQRAATSCRDVGAVAGADHAIKHYQVRGVCGSIEAAE